MSQQEANKAPAEPSWLRAIILPDTGSEAEQAFRRYYQARTLPIAQVGAGIAIALIAAVCVLDWIVMPPEFALPAIGLRILTMLSILVAVLAASVIWPASPLIPYAFMTAAIVTGVCTVIVGGIAARSGTEFVVWGTVFTTFYVYLVFGLRFRLATLAGWPVLITFVTAGLLLGSPFVKLAYGTLFLVFANVVGMVTSFLLERDARELFAKEQSLENLARTDGLTGIDNRRSFDEHLVDAWRQASRDDSNVAVVLIDIDHFKLYNDCYGHQEGDACIQAVAEVISDSVNRPLDQVARYGGEEFAVVLYDASDEFVHRYVDELTRDVAELDIEHKASDVARHVTVSVGAATMRADPSRLPESLVRTADDALYESKAKGRDRATVFELSDRLQVTGITAAIAL